MLYADQGDAAAWACCAPTWRAPIRCGASWRRGAQCLVVFQGPDAYISPGWYESKRTTHKVVPTWNFATVHARGAARVVDDAAWLRRQLDDLTKQHEASLPQPWKVDDAPADFLAATMKAIVGIEIPIDSLVGKWKVSQNRSAADQRGVVEGLQQHPMAQLVAERLKPD